MGIGSTIDLPIAPSRTVPQRFAPLGPALRQELIPSLDEPGQVVVHCEVVGDGSEHVRIWPTTYLVCRHTGTRSKLLFAEGIAMPPNWMPLLGSGMARFTLIFAGLSKECVLFDLFEEIPEHGAFSARGILRNAMDVYRVRLD